MIRRLVAEVGAPKLAQTQAVGHAPGDTALVPDALVAIDQQRSEIVAQCDARPPLHRLEVAFAKLLHHPIELALFQNLIRLRVDKDAAPVA